MTAPNISKFPFMFERPEQQESLGNELNVVLALGALASRLTREERTRTIHPDGRNENVAEHGFMLAKVSVALADSMYPWMDRGRVAIHAINHDDPEAYVGDTPTDIIANHDAATKKEIEALGVEKLSHDYFDIAPAYVNDMHAYEEQEELEAQFVRIVDKMMVLLIHVPNNGAVIKEFYTREQFLQSTQESEQRLLEQYPHFIELIELRTQLALYLCDTYFTD